MKHEDNVELILNLVWLGAAVAAFLAWYLWRVDGPSRTQQLIVLMLVVAILFPVISMTDDVWAAQNPAEPDSAQRRHHLVAVLHGMVPTPMIIASQPPIPAMSHQGRRALDSDADSVSLQFLVGCLVFTRPPPQA
jgi:hypothetical protein